MVANRKAMRARTLIALAATLCAGTLPAAADPYGSRETLPPSVPAGFVVTLAASAATPTTLAFSPDGAALYVGSGGQVLRYPVFAGAVLGPPSVFLSGLRQVLGVLATADGVFVSDNTGDNHGIVYRARDLNGDGAAEVRDVLIRELPNGRHNTNGMAIGPDGKLYIANGNNTDSGFGAEGGPREVQPYSGSLVRVDPTATSLTPDPTMVVATGFRNIYDVAFLPGTSIAAVPMNGPDGLRYGSVTRPRGEDLLALIDTADSEIEHFGFPWCLYDRDKGGLGGFVQDPIKHDTPSGDCTTLPTAASTGLDPATVAFEHPSALFGMNVSADGLAFESGDNFPPAYDGDLFVAEFGNFYGDGVAGHKVVRVQLGAAGSVASVDDFMTGVLPLDLTFAPDGALWVADYEGAIYRIAAVA